MLDVDLEVRRLRYRLQRQGMLELDAWLSHLEGALALSDEAVMMAISRLLACEPPDLQAMMHGDKPLPQLLEPWLK